MNLTIRNWRVGIGLSIILLLAVACAPTAEPTATTAAAQPTATTAVGAPTATTGVTPPTATTVPEAAKLRPIPVLESPPPNPDAAHGGVLSYSRSGWPADFSIWEAASGTLITPQLPNNETFLEMNAWEPDMGNELLPNVAYDWWTDSTGLEWTFAIREGILFHDGVELTCADVEFMIETVRDGHDATGSELRHSPRAASLRRVADVSCADDYTLVAVTDGPMPSLPSTLGGTGTLAIKPKHVFEGNLSLMLDDYGVGVGPFMLEELTVGESMVWKRNPSYFNQPYPYLDGIEHIFGQSGVAREAATRVGRLDIGYVPTAKYQDVLDEGRLNLQFTLSTSGFGALQANWTREPWNDPRFSLALRCVIDIKEYNDVIANGWGFEQPIFSLAEDGGSPWGLTAEEWAAVGPCHGPADTLPPMEERVEIARQAIADMGYGPDNPLRPFFSMWCSQGSANCSYMDHLALYGPRLEEIGVIVEWTAFETARAYDKAYAGEFDVQPWGYRTPGFDPDPWLYEHYYSTSDRNYGKYTNPEVDALIDLQSQTLDQEKRAQLIKDISRILLHDNAKIIFRGATVTAVMQPWVKDYIKIDVTNMSGADKLTRTWLDEDAKAAGVQ